MLDASAAVNQGPWNAEDSRATVAPVRRIANDDGHAFQGEPRSRRPDRQCCVVVDVVDVGVDAVLMLVRSRDGLDGQAGTGSSVPGQASSPFSPASAWPVDGGIVESAELAVT